MSHSSESHDGPPRRGFSLRMAGSRLAALFSILSFGLLAATLIRVAEIFSGGGLSGVRVWVNDLGGEVRLDGSGLSRSEAQFLVLMGAAAALGYILLLVSRRLRPRDHAR